MGSPAAGTAQLPMSYNRYLKVRDLKQLQSCLSDPPHHDEPLFIIIHQTYELWFKLILHELDFVIQCLAEDKIGRATFFMHRVNSVMGLLVNQIHILETMSPMGFLGFRNKLNPASGFQSTQFREIEILGGLRDKRLLEHFRAEAEEFSRLVERSEAPSLGDAFYSMLRRHGFNLPSSAPVDRTGDPSAHTAADPAEDARVEELRKLYEETDRYRDYYNIAETFVEFDERLALWRLHHVTVVERIMGFKTGTGGSEGVQYLRSTLHKRCFPDLWRVRTAIEYREQDCL
jgi:tryptophan 2,3-dioxygenase